MSKPRPKVRLGEILKRADETIEPKAYAKCRQINDLMLYKRKWIILSISKLRSPLNPISCTKRYLTEPLKGCFEIYEMKSPMIRD